MLINIDAHVWDSRKDSFDTLKARIDPNQTTFEEISDRCERKERWKRVIEVKTDGRRATKPPIHEYDTPYKTAFFQDVPTCALVEELSRREGVVAIDQEADKTLAIKRPNECIVMVIED